MPRIQRGQTTDKYDHIEVFPSGWVKCWNGEWGDDNTANHYPPQEVNRLGGEVAYNVNK